MNIDNQKIIRVAVSEAGDFLKGKLPVLPEHSVRNSYAHIWCSIKEQMGKSYSLCSDEDVPTILSIISSIRKEGENILS